MQDPASQQSYQSSYQKHDAYDDEPYEIVQDGYELNRYPTVDDILAHSANIMNSGKKEPVSPTFSYSFQNPTARISTLDSTNRTVSNRESEFAKQMGQKIKKQAEQLHELSNYKVLCEKRILELAPGHPLPVQPSHLGTSAGVDQQIMQLQEVLEAREEELTILQNQLNQYMSGKPPMRNGREDSTSSSGKFIGGDDVVGSYNILCGKYKALLEEKQSLEESLRNETLVHEEQRAYTEILKQMLDEKFDAIEIAKWVTGLPERGKVDLLIEFKAANEKLEQLQNELAYYRENFQGRNSEMEKVSEEATKLTRKNEELENENLKLSEMNIRLNQAVKTCEAELKNLEQEKTNLIDFADEQASKSEKLANENNELNKRFEELEEDYRELLDKLNNANNQILNLEEELGNLRNEKAEMEIKTKEIEEQYNFLIEEKQQITSRQKEVKDLLATQEETKMATENELEKLRQESDELEKERDNKNREIEELRKNLDKVTKEHAKLQQKYAKKESKFQDEVDFVKKEYETKLINLEEQIEIYEKNEGTLKGLIEKNNNEITRIQKLLTSSKDQTKKLEDNLEETKKLYKKTQNENKELRETIDNMEKETMAKEEDNLMASQELARLKEGTEKNFYKISELTNLNATLEKRLRDKEREILEYENIVNESKKRAERERQLKMEEIKRLYDENGDLKRELHTLRDNYAKSSSALNLKEEEMTVLKNHLEKKTQQIRTLMDENRLYKQKADDLDYLQEQLASMRNENDKNAKGLREYEEQIENKAYSLKNTMSKLETAEQELFTTLSNIMELQRERADLLAENSRLQRKVEELKQEKENSEIQRAIQEEKHLQISLDYEKAQKNLNRVSKDLEEMSTEYYRLLEEINTSRDGEKSYNHTLNLSMEQLKGALAKIKQYITIYSDMLATSPDALNILGKRFRTLLDTFSAEQYSKDGKDVKSLIVRTSEYTREVVEVVLEELENLGRRVIDLKQDLAIGNQRIATLERKCNGLNVDEAQMRQREFELRKEIEMLKEELGSFQRDRSNFSTKDVRLEKENVELKEELKRLQNEVRELMSSMKSSNYDRKQESQDIKGQDLAALQEKCKVAQKEKKSYEEILQRVCNLLANPELQRAIMDLVKVQNEIDQTEREKYSLEVKLGEMETDFKLYIKKTPNLSPNKSSSRRAEIENARSDLNNAASQLLLLRKRKNLVLEDLKSFEIMEKKRYETSVHTERSLLDAKKQLQELKTQNYGLERVNTTLKDTVKTISKERQFLDNENIKLKYQSLTEPREANNVESIHNKYPERQQTEALYNMAEREQIKENLRREGPFQTQRVLTGVSSLEEAADDGWDSKPIERSFTDRNAIKRNEGYGGFMTDKKETSYIRQIENESSQQKMRLKDRLDQTKNILSSVRKSYERHNLH